MRPVLFCACSPYTVSMTKRDDDHIGAPAQTESIVLGGGCFWCLEAAYQLIKGVTSVLPGYAGGHLPNPTYEQVAGQTTGHAEVVRVEFDPGVTSLAGILDVFWTIHNPTTLNRQGADIGPEYRSIILYGSEAQRRTAEASRTAAQANWDDPIVTEVKPLERFYEAEPEHRDYYRKRPNQAYCQIVINPKLAKLRAKFDILPS